MEQTMQGVLNTLKIRADVVSVENSGTMVKYLLSIGAGEKVNKLEKYSTEISLALKSYSKPIIKIISELGLVSIEVLNSPAGVVKFSDIVGKLKNETASIPLILGRTHDGKDLITDLTKMPHILLAGSTGSGKSVMLHSFISSMILSKKNIRLVLIDPKTVEFTYYSNIKQLLYPIIHDLGSAQDVMEQLTEEMEERFDLMYKCGTNSVVDYNIKKHSKMLPYIVLIIDEFSDLFISDKKRDKYKNLCMLAQKSRACGIHIIIATQRPSVDVITGLIKANFPARISCRLPSLFDSRVILDQSGAEKLLGNGDAIIHSSAHDMIRFKGAFLNTHEIEQICLNNKRSNVSILRNFLGI